MFERIQTYGEYCRELMAIAHLSDRVFRSLINRTVPFQLRYLHDCSIFPRSDCSELKLTFDFRLYHRIFSKLYFKPVYGGPQRAYSNLQDNRKVIDPSLVGPRFDEDCGIGTG